MNETATSTDRWTAAHVRTSRRLFATCGDAGASATEPVAAVALTECAGQFAWHAELLYELLPVRAGIDREALVAVHVVGADHALDELSALAHDDASSACVVIARVVVPRLAAGAEGALSTIDRALDGPRFRALRLVVRDLRDAQRDLELAAEQLLVDTLALERATAGCGSVERCLVDAGALRGLFAVATVD